MVTYVHNPNPWKVGTRGCETYLKQIKTKQSKELRIRVRLSKIWEVFVGFFY